MVLRWIFAVALLFFSAGFALIAWRAANPPIAVAPLPAQAATLPDAPVAEPAPRPPARLAAVVTRRAVQPGMLLKGDDVAVRELDATQVPEDAFLQEDLTAGELSGALVRASLPSGTVLTRADVLRPRDRGFLAAVLRPSMRAISIGVDAVTGTAGLIWPGDQVDLILTQELDGNASPPGRRVVGETVLSNVRVIAVDQEITQGARGTSASLGGQGPRNVARTVTLEVTTDQAERVAVAERLGRLSLTVRPIDLDTTPTMPATSSVFGSDVSPALSTSGAAVGVRMRVFQGGELSEITFR